MESPKSLLRNLGLLKWPPYFPQLLATTNHKRDGRARFNELKGSLFYNLAHLVPQRPWEPLEEAIHVAYGRRKLSGAYAEFGVYTGRSSVRAYYYMRSARRGNAMHMFAFDSFQGLPELADADRVRYQDFTAGSYACTENNYRANIKALGVPDDAVTTVPGWFADTCSDSIAAQIGLEHIGVAHIDCDILSATLTVLRFLADRMEDGGVVVFDDWGSYRGHPELGQRGALAQLQNERHDLWITTERADAGGSAFVSFHRKLDANERARAPR